MEETRISRMYLAIVTRALGRSMEKLMGGAWLKSAVTWIVLAVLALVGIGVAVHEKGSGDLTRLKTQLGTPPPVAEVEAVQPGGVAPIVITRSPHPGAFMPEFVSATLLPGRGMNVLQITAFVPGKGVVPLLASPTLADAAKAMSGTGDDANGQASLTTGAAIEVPWAGPITGALLPGGLSVMANWHGHGLKLATNRMLGQTQAATGGLLLRRNVTSAAPAVMPDGGLVEASFNAENFGASWPSKTNVNTTVSLSSGSLDLTIVARNTGSEPTPMGIGWSPRFAIASGNRSQVRLRVPSGTRLETTSDGLPTGRLLPVQDTPLDFSDPDGSLLKATALDDLYVHLKTGLLSSGPEVELRDPATGYGLRMTLLSSSIKALRVTSPANGGFIVLHPQTNYDDPFGREWGQNENTGVVVLKPNEALQWKVRLELFSLTNHGPVN